MADFAPKAGSEDVRLVGVVNPAGASIHGNMVGQAYDVDGTEIALPAGYSFVEESPLETRLVCPTTPDANDALDVIVGQKADSDLADGDPVYIKSNTFTVKTVAPTAATITTTSGVVPK